VKAPKRAKPDKPEERLESEGHLPNAEGEVVGRKEEESDGDDEVFTIGDRVVIQDVHLNDKKRRQWAERGTVMEKCTDRSFVAVTDEGKERRRNAQFLRLDPRPVPPPTTPPPQVDNTLSALEWPTPTKAAVKMVKKRGRKAKGEAPSRISARLVAMAAGLL
jgi:hypothetical protein